MALLDFLLSGMPLADTTPQMMMPEPPMGGVDGLGGMGSRYDNMGGIYEFPPQQQLPQQKPIPTRNIADAMQVMVGAKEPETPNMAQNILAGRFSEAVNQMGTGQGPSFGDYSSAAISSLYGKPATAVSFANDRNQTMMKQIASIAELQGKPSEFDRLVQTYQALPDNDPRKVMYGDRLKKETTITQMGMPIPVYDPRTNMPTYVNREDIAPGGYMPPPPAGYKYGTNNQLVPTQPSPKDQARLAKSTDAASSAAVIERLSEETIGILDRYKTSKGATAIGTGEQILNVFPESWGWGDKEKLADFERLDKISKEFGAVTLQQFGGNDTDRELQISIQTNVDPKAGVPANMETIQRKLLASQILQQRPIFEEEWLNKNGSLSAADLETGETFSRSWLGYQKGMWKDGLQSMGLAKPTAKQPTNEPDLNDPGFQEFLRNKGR